MKKRLFFILIALMTLTACATGGGQTTQTPTSPTVGYPGPALNTAYPPGVNNDAPAELPKNLAPTSNQVGAVKGYLTHTSKNSNPNLFPAVYLGEIKVDSNGTPLIAALDKSNAPKAVVDQKGKFAFQNVPPGSYLLMVDVIDSFITKQTADGKEQLITVEGGKLMDVGEIQIP